MDEARLYFFIMFLVPVLSIIIIIILRY